ncbi:MAG: tRNA uridine-5-carboxymethylaminomethyl(34) synthesis GTPase MnmE [Alphaproteobacteria bacterium]
MDNIYALSTAPGKSGVAIVRISGNNLVEALSAFNVPSNIKPRYATLVKICDPLNGDVIDNAIIIWFPAPNSFTGEDIIEFHIHGSRAIINSTIGALSTVKGMRIAEPGEFSRRAFFNNKLDLTAAEGLEDLINAETKAQQKQALRQMSGELEKLYEDWRIKLIRTLALIEAYIDFPEEDIPEEVIEEIITIIESLKLKIANHLDDNRKGEKLREGLFFAIIGAPNVGKSSLLNFLAKKDVAIVSNIAGTTRDIIETSLDIGGVPVTLADTAGLRESSDVIENEGIKRALLRAKEADYKIAMFDANHIDDLDKQTLELIDDNTIILFNKIDQIEKSKLNLLMKNSIFISIKNKIGTEEFLNKLEDITSELASPSSTPLITRARYRENLTNCLECLYNFSLELDIELAAEELRMAASFLGQITGKIDIEMILDEIFSSFCIGK